MQNKNPMGLIGYSTRYFFWILLLLLIPKTVKAQLTGSGNIANGNFTTCSYTLFDDGGPSGNYSETNYQTTICAETGSQLYIVLQFLNLGSNVFSEEDILIIYNGTGTNGQILFNSQTDNVPSNLLLANSGCITISLNTNPHLAFTSTDEGFEMEISCTPPETCNDGILNNGEVQVDCGGPNCSPCLCSNNVVINGDFEATTNVCPSPANGPFGTAQQISCPWTNQTPVEGWFGIANRDNIGIIFPSPDYLNDGCTSLGNFDGSVPCMNGNGSVGYWAHFSDDQRDREYLQTELLEPLEAGIEYCISYVASSRRGTRPPPIQLRTNSAFIFTTILIPVQMD